VPGYQGSVVIMGSNFSGAKAGFQIRLFAGQIIVWELRLIHQLSFCTDVWTSAQDNWLDPETGLDLLNWENQESVILW